MSKRENPDYQDNEIYRELFKPKPKTQVIHYMDLKVYDVGVKEELKRKEIRLMEVLKEKQ